MSDLLHSGALQHLDSLHVDWPVWLNVKTENGTRVRDRAHAQFRSSMNIEHFFASTKAFSLSLCSCYFRSLLSKQGLKQVSCHYLKLPCLSRRSIERIQALISSEDMGLARVTEISGLDDEMYGWTEQQPPLPHCQ